MTILENQHIIDFSHQPATHPHLIGILFFNYLAHPTHKLSTVSMDITVIRTSLL